MAQEQPGGTLAGHVRVAPRDLGQAGQQFRAQAQNLDEQVSAPLNAVEQGNGAAWTSGSHTEYLRLHNSLLGTLRHAQQATHHLGVGMSQSGSAYGVLNQTRFNVAPATEGDGLDPFDTIRVAGASGRTPGDSLPNFNPGDKGRGIPADKTRGVLVKPDGTELPLISGEDAGLRQWRQQHPDVPVLGANSHSPLWTHVEGQTAWIMRRDNVKNATLWINNTPCTTPIATGCDDFLPYMLPEGSTLTVNVKQPGGVWTTKVYTGIADSKWPPPHWPPGRP